MKDQNLQPANSPRNPFIAFLFSLVLPGLAQVYNGQLIKGIIFFSLFILLPVLFGIFSAANTFYGYAILFTIELLFRIYILIDGVVVAKRFKNYIPKPYNTWYYHLLIVLGVIVIFWFYDTRAIIGIQSNIVPSPANEPTIQIGDRVITDLHAYKKAQPGYGDIIVYQNDKGIQYAFRVAGLPNDTIAIEQHIVTINGRKSKSTFIKDAINEEYEVSEFEEEFPDGHKHLIYKNKETIDTAVANMENIIVPPNSYFVLGDNRDNASDSRYEGCVKRDKIIGRVVYSYWGQSKDRININFTAAE
jgi:signal peptidase I